MSPGGGRAASPGAAAATTPGAPPRLARGLTSTDARLPAACPELVRQTADEISGASQQPLASASTNAALPVASGVAVGAGTASGDTVVGEAGGAELGGRGSPGALPRKRRRRGELQSLGGPEVLPAAGVDEETQEIAPRRSARVAARTVVQHVRSRIVIGFGERVEDVAADETLRLRASRLPSDDTAQSAAGDVAVSAGAVSGEPGLTEAGRRETGAFVSAGGVLRRRERGEAPASSTSEPEVVGAAGSQAETRLVSTRRSGRVGRIVTGFDRRIDDVAGDEARRSAEEAQRAAARRNAGTRGRMTGFSGEDLDRGAGGAWHAGRR